MKLGIEVEAKPAVKKYYAGIVEEVERQLAVAGEAKEKGFDISSGIESKPVADLADRTETIIGPVGVAARYRLVFEEKKGDRLEAIFQIFKEILEQKWCKIGDESKRVEQAIKTSLVLNTEGVVVAPLDGVPKIEINKNPDGSRYIDIYYAGPIRAAGGTSQVLPLILGDYARKILGIDRYKPTGDEVERYVEECQIYDEIVTRQYKPSDEEVRRIARGCPVCINGEPTEEREVAINRNLSRITSNRVRGGMCLVLSEGVALKAAKILVFAKRLGLDWNWLEGIIKVEKSDSGKREIKPNEKFLAGTAAGRPILAYPSRFGGFRLRYGRARNMGIMGKGISPATMHLLDGFIANATQMKVERPGKAAGMAPVDSIEGPIVRLLNGSVVKANSLEEAIKIKPAVERILFLGDLLVSVGDFRYSAHPLVPVGYCSEWWAKEVERQLGEKAKKLADALKHPEKVSVKQAIELSEKFNVPLHPKALFYYTGLSKKKLLDLAQFLKKGKRKGSSVEFGKDEQGKKLLEKIGICHQVKDNKVLVKEGDFLALEKTLGLGKGIEKLEEALGKSVDVIAALSLVSGMQIRDLAGTWIGARMGRPEASRPRKMIGNPHMLFPISSAGGNTRSINKAMERQGEGKQGSVSVEIALYKCPKCKAIREQPFCKQCNERAEKVSICPSCGSVGKGKTCLKCGIGTEWFSKRSIDLPELMHQAGKNLGVKIPPLVKGVKGMINEGKIAEPLEKGILRAKHDLHVFRDATIRYEAINAPLTHFKPEEIGLTVEKTKQLGYEKDCLGKNLESPDQTVEIMPQDIVVDEKAGDFFVTVSKFVDELLARFYKMQPYFNANKKEDMVGQLVLGLAPHTSAAIVGRIIGFTKARACYAHPYFIQTKRRNCLRGNTQILIEDCGKLKSIQIKELDDGTKKRIVPLLNKTALTIQENGGIKKEKIIGLFKKKAPKRIFRIKAAGGREIEVTADHKMLVWEKGIKVVKVNRLKKGQKLLSLAELKSLGKVKEIDILKFYLEKDPARKKKLRMHGAKKILSKKLKEDGYCKTSREIGYRTGKAIHTAVDFDAVPLDLFELLVKRFKLKEKDFGNLLIGYNKQKSQMPVKITLSKELGMVVGYFYGDGWARTSYKKGKEKFVYQVGFVSAEKSNTKKLCQLIEKVFGRKPTVEKKGNCNIVTLSGRVFYEFFIEMLKTGKGAKKKQLSGIVLNAPNEFIEAMLAGYISSDGCVDRNAIKVCSVNKTLINQMGIACTLLGIYPHFYKEEKIIKTGRLFEFYGKTFKSRLFGFRLYSNDLMKFKGKLLGKRKEKLDQAIKKINFKGKRTEKVGKFALNTIKSIEKVPCKDKFVYDLIVEGNKTFIAGHGSLAVYDCDGDQDSLMLLMDNLLNFSHSYLPGSRGGRMDAPLVFTVALKPTEIDNECYEMETCWGYPIELYEVAQKIVQADIEGIKRIEGIVGREGQYSGFGFTHPTARFDAGPKISMYVQLTTMEKKLRGQARLQGRIEAVDSKDALERVMINHLMPDIIGNARAFSRQKFRCTNCNAKIRRIPLDGKCPKCRQEKIILTVNEGGVRKYLGIAKSLAAEFELSHYLRQRLELIEQEINSVFQNEQPEQKKLAEYV